MEQNPNTSLFQLNLDDQNSYTLRSAATWAKVLGVVSMIMGGLFIVLGIMVQQSMSRYSAYDSYRYRGSGLSSGAIGGWGLAIYVLFGLMYIISAIFALNAGNKINAGLKGNDQAALNAGFAGARNFFAFWAILLIIGLLFILLGILGSM